MNKHTVGIALAATLALAACGSDDTSDETTAFRLDHTREQQAELGMDSDDMEEANATMEAAFTKTLADADMEAICDRPTLLYTIVELAGMEPPMSDWLETDINNYLADTC